MVRVCGVLYARRTVRVNTQMIYHFTLIINDADRLFLNIYTVIK